MELTHFNKAGRARMVDVTVKDETRREAVAEGRVKMLPATLALIQAGAVGKGDVLSVAQVAGIMAAKQTWQLIPMCHPLLLTGVDIAFNVDESASVIDIVATVRTTGKTGVEMEALTAVSVAALTIYDMAKAVDKGMVVEYIRLAAKSGGKSGNYVRQDRD
jgi:cyclic pyranopterin phosphate synthase